MLTAVILGLLSGAALGFRFRTFVIIPATLVLAGLLAAEQILLGQPVWSMAIGFGLGAVFLQIGYLAGSLVGVSRGPEGLSTRRALRFSDPAA